MMAGSNIRVTILRDAYMPDDAGGGAQPTGSVLYENVAARRSQIKPTMALMDQGLETGKNFTFSFSDGTLGVRENDDILVVWPYHDPWINKTFRIIGVQQTSMQAGDPRRFVEVYARRSEIAHKEPQF
jgi:hypothetical protein